MASVQSENAERAISNESTDGEGERERESERNRAAAQIAELRAEIRALAETAQNRATVMAGTATTAVEDGAEELRSTMARHPGLTIAGGAALGVAVALLVTAARDRHHRAGNERLRYSIGHTADSAASGIRDMTAAVERAIDRAAPRQDLAAMSDRVADLVHAPEAQDTLAKLARRVAGTFNDARRRVAERTN